MDSEKVRRLLVEHDVPAKMRDGTTLRADVYRPDGDGPYPVLLTRLPYGKDVFRHPGLDTLRGAMRDYIVVVQDVRGRFRSEGQWTPFQQEFDDGYDSVVWAANLPGSDGRVAMFGGSYLGMTQWSAAVTSPPGLVAMAPIITGGNQLNGMVRRGGARELGLTLYWHLGILAPSELLRQHAGDMMSLMQKLPALVSSIDHIDALYRTIPLADVPDPDHVIRWFFETMSLGVDAPELGALNTDSRYGEVQVPTLHIAGWYDIFLGETLRQYEIMRRLAIARGTTPPRLIIGPWTHGNFGSSAGDLSFGLASSGLLMNYRGDLTDIHLQFFDGVMGRPARGFAPPAVEVFIMGENSWRSFEAWPVPEAREERWYLHSQGGANTASGDGLLSREVPGDEPLDRYVYDPMDPVPTIGGHLLMPDSHRPGPLDQSGNEGRPDVLCYTSEVLESPYTVVGPVHATLYAASSCSDTDFVARLVDVHPDGRAICLADGIIRALWRESYPAPGEVSPVPASPIEPGQVYLYTIDLWATGITFLAGHRLRVEITSSSFPRWDRNLNLGDDDFAGRGAPVSAMQQVLHDAAHPSFVTLCHL